MSDERVYEVVSIDELVETVKKALMSTGYFQQGQAGETLTESIPEVPLVQVYLQRGGSGQPGTSDRISFGDTRRPRRNVTVGLVIDVYTRQRSDIGNDMKSVHTGADVVNQFLDQQERRPFFGCPAIDAFSYTYERVEFTYGDVKYVGLRYDLPLTII